MEKLWNSFHNRVAAGVYTPVCTRQLVPEQDSCCRMPALGSGASKAELALQDQWCMEGRWEQVALRGQEP